MSATQSALRPRAEQKITSVQRWTLALASVGSFLVVLDMLAVSTALPALRVALHGTITTLDWTVNAYTLSFAVLMMTAAGLGDRWGRKPTYVGGLVLFAAASAACALAPNVGVLIAARAVQGVGAAVLMPLALSLINTAFPAQRRGWAMGTFGSVTGLGSVLGPVLGGVITQAASWSWIFWINVPVSILTAAAVLLRVPDSRGTVRRLDPAGLVLGGIAALALVWGVVRAAGSGWGDPLVVGSLVVGIVALVALIGWERRAAQPMVPLRLFADRGFATGSAGIFLMNASLTAVVFFTAQFLQNAQGNGPLAAGLRLLPFGVVPLLLASWSGRSADRLGTRPMILTGFVAQIVGVALLAGFATPTVSYVVLAGGMVVVAVAFTLAIPAMTKAVVGSVEPADVSTASGLFSTLRQMGGAFGVAVTSTAFTATGGYADARDVADGFRGAMVVAAVLAVLGLAAVLFARSTARSRG
jgi:EmrB/QacA subfamily drug resistance transporter